MDIGASLVFEYNLILTVSYSLLQPRTANKIRPK
jgi:hypothetical protein